MPAARTLAPGRLVPRTLRGRLIAGLMALLTLACAAVGLVTYLAVQGSLSRELNSELQTATGLAYKCWEHQDTGAPASGTQASGTQARASAASGGQGMSSGHSRGASATAWSSANGAAGDPSPSASATPRGTAAGGTTGTGTSGPGAPATTRLPPCQGLGEQTFVAVVTGHQWSSAMIPNRTVSLSPADQRALMTITPVAPPFPEDGSPQPVQTSTRYLHVANGTFELTAVRSDNGSLYITGLPLSNVHDTLRDVALAEAAVFSLVLLLAGVLGTLWVRFSLRPLHRVAATAAQVADLPLEAGEVSLPVGVPDTDPRTETGQVGIAFNRMLGHIETGLRRRAASEARLRRFAADASHELRTPLAAIRGYAELGLLRPGDAPDEVTHALGRVLSESRRMSTLVDDLLLLARLDAGRPLNSEPVDMTRLAIDAASDAQVARTSHRWVLELPDDPVYAAGDEDRLRQVLANLLSNAGRHTPDGTTVTVRVSDALPLGEPGGGPASVARGTLPAGPRLVVSVTDDGPGIPADLLPELFERFTRADTSRSHAADASSTGLGLAIVDAVVAAHEGAVLVTSQPGMTRFTIVLTRL
jgi:two-component system, OmpR family, sensor kinase